MDTEHKKTLSNLATTFVLAALALAAVFGSGVVVFSPPEFLTGERDAERVQIHEELTSRTILDYADTEEADVVYAYVGEPLPETLATNEIVELRTETSYTKHLGVDEFDRPTFTTVVYPQKTFTKQSGAWHYIEYARAPRDLFNDIYLAPEPLSFLFGTPVYAEDIFSGAGDGKTPSTATGTWDSAHDAVSGSGVDSTGTTATVASQNIFVKGDGYSITRAFLPFITSSIPASATITAATLNIFVTAKTNEDNDGTDYITVVQTSQGTHTTLADTDYDQCGVIDNPTEGVDSGQRKDITSISTSAYLVFTLNATGRGWIKVSGVDAPCSATNGISCFGLREGHDTTDVAVTSGSTNADLVTFSTSENSGTTQDPYLSVTYSTPASFQDIFEF